jgi:TRAP-type C4-dicarboxylate transport system permease small subunit
MMHGSIQDHTDLPSAAPGNSPLAALDRCMGVINRIIVFLSAIALIGACLILSYSVLIRGIFNSPTYWQDEAAVFLLVGITFMSAAFVQSQRGHIGIEAFIGLLSPAINRVRLLLVDVATFLFCGFFAWKSWTLTHEAWVDGQVTDSMWAPPLALPYSLMALGMTLLSLQILLQIVAALTRRAQS